MAQEIVVNARGKKATYLRELFSLARTAAESKVILTRVGLTLLGRIKKAFVVKARGGTDECGLSWPPLSPKTIAYNRARRTKTEKKRDSHPSQALNAKQQKRWWEIYCRALAQYKGDKSHAAAVAWFVLKREGAKTLLDKYGNRKVEILRDTGLLLNSLTPGYSGTEQVFQVGNAEVVVGTNRKGASAHHNGNPARNLPQRRLWAEPNQWTSNWWEDLLEAAKQGLLEIAIQLIRGVK